MRAGGRHLLHADLDAVLDGLLGLLRALRRPDVVDRDVDPLLAQADGDRLTDARAAAGDQCRLALQTLHVLLLSMSARPCTKKSTASSGVLIRSKVTAAPNGAFQNVSADGGPSCGPT